MNTGMIYIVSEIVYEAGRMIKDARLTNMFSHEFKNDDTPVTDIDFKVQKYITQKLHEHFEYQVMGEESKNEIDATKPYWAIDPIDGTWAFISQENTSVINLSLIEGGEIRVGIVYNPFTEEFFVGHDNDVSYMGSQKLPLLANREITIVNFKPERGKMFASALTKMYEEGQIKKLVSIGGSITYSICMVAKGAFSNYVTYFSNCANPWDITAAYIVLKNSGGVLTDLDGNEIDPVNHKGFIIASSNKEVNRLLINTLREKLHF